jgi:Protein of unknown function (DUF4235)
MPSVGCQSFSSARVFLFDRRKEIRTHFENRSLAMKSPALKKLRRVHPINPAGEAISFITAFAVGAGLNMLLKRFWLRVYGHEAPTNPTQPGVNWSEALTWGIAAGATAGVAKVFARRGTDIAQAKWQRSRA